jgi:tellurite resistance protein TehA-like permease
VILLGFGLGNLMNNPVKSFSFALGVLCLVVWPFLAINIHRYLKKLEYEEGELEEIIEELKIKN